MDEALGGDLGGDQILVIFNRTEFTEYFIVTEITKVTVGFPCIV